MLDKFKKSIGLSAKTVDSPQTIVKETEMADAAQITQLSELVSAQAATLQELKETVATLSEKYTAAKTELEAIETQKQLEVEAAAKAKFEARQASLSTAIGTEKAATLMASLASLDDVAFNTVVSTMSAGLDAEANAPTFKETGVSFENTEPVGEQVVHFNKYTGGKK